MSIGREGIQDERSSISVWRVYLPFDVDRDQYVKTCFLTGSITVINDNGEIVNNVKIGRIAVQLVSFPLDRKSFGSKVLCVTEPYSGNLYVVDVFASSNEFHDQKENQYRLYKKTDTGFAELRIDGSGKLILTVDSEGDSEIVISATNKNRNSKLIVNVNGDILVQNDGNTTFKSSKQVLIDSPKILLNESEEPILLGTKTTDLIKELLDQLAKESAGPYPLLGRAVYGQIKKKVDALKSKLSFVK